MTRPRAVILALAFGCAAVGCTERIPLLAGVPGRGTGESDGAAAGASGAHDGAAGRNDATGAAGSDAAVMCEEAFQGVPIHLTNLQVLIALDRSWSMLNRRLNDRTRIQSIRFELLNLVKNNQGAVAFGYEEFPAKTACDRSMGCCASPVLVAPSLSSYSLIENQSRCDTGSGCPDGLTESPTDQALIRARTYFESDPNVDSERFVFLVTDGEPDCSADANACPQALAETGRLASKQVKTLVLALGDEVTKGGCLDLVSGAGLAPRPGSPSYVFVMDGNRLREQMQEALSPVLSRTCRFVIDRSVPPDKFVLLINSTITPRDPNRRDGWNFEPGSSSVVRFYGNLCDRLRSGQVPAQEVLGEVRCTVCDGKFMCP